MGAAIWQNHLSHFFCFIAIFVFHRVFSNQDGPSRFFPALGFRRYIYIYTSVFTVNGSKWIERDCRDVDGCDECYTRRKFASGPDRLLRICHLFLLAI